MINLIKSLLILSVLVLPFAMSTPAAAYSGIYGFGIELNASGANVTNPGLTLYGLADGGDSRLTPTGSTSTPNSGWTAASTAHNPTYNLGTFTTSDTLILTGGSMLTYQGSGDNVTAATLDYNVVPVGSISSSFSTLSLAINSTDPSGNGNNDKRFSTESSSVNLLAGLAPGTYEIDTFGFANATNGTQFINGNGDNYGATFTVVAATAVPEPSVWGFLLIGIAGLAGINRFRRLSRA